MLKLLRKSVAISAVAVVATLLLAGPSMAIDLDTSDCGTVLSVADGDYELVADMNCSTTHGLIIGASGITIDGKGHSITGTLSGYDCKVGDVECVDGTPEHPQPCRDELSSGIYNAYADGVTGSGCQGTTAGQGGCDDVTVMDLEITGFCDGIFMSGSCRAGSGNPPDASDWLQGCKVLGNYIHDNGKSDASCVTDMVGCGNVNLCANDGIFMAMTGVPVGSPGLTAALAYDCSYAEMRDTLNVSANLVMGQKGYARETGPAGNGINVLGGMEENTGSTYYGACGQITNNSIYSNEVSGIMVTTATNLLIKGNNIKNNGYGGITIPCDFNPGNRIEANYMDSNEGPGIGVVCWQEIVNNTVLNAKNYSGDDLGFSSAAAGIYCESSGQDIYAAGDATGPSIVVDNYVANSASGNDIAVGGDDVTIAISCAAFENSAGGNWVNTLGSDVPNGTTPPGVPSCKASGPWASVPGDVDLSGLVDQADLAEVYQYWGQRPVGP